MSTHQSNASNAAGRPARPLLPILEVRFTASYAWILMGAGGIFFFLSFMIGKQNPGLGIFIAILSVAGVFGGNYWRHHLHVVARMTSRQLILQRAGGAA
jgi:hypothetical protein